MKKCLIFTFALLSSCAAPLTGSFDYEGQYDSDISSCETNDGPPIKISFFIIDESSVGIFETDLILVGEVGSNNIEVDSDHPQSTDYIMSLKISDWESQKAQMVVTRKDNPFCWSVYPGVISNSDY